MTVFCGNASPVLGTEYAAPQANKGASAVVAHGTAQASGGGTSNRSEIKARCQAALAARVPDSVLAGDALRCAQYRADAAVLARYVRSQGAVTTKAQMSLFRMEATISRAGEQSRAAGVASLAGLAAARREALPDGNHGDNNLSGTAASQP